MKSMALHNISQVLMARINEIDVAFDFSIIDEVLLMCALQPIPEVPSWVAGSLYIDGESITVIDVHARMKQTTHQPHINDLIIVCRFPDARPLGLIVQEVLDIAHIETSDIQPINELIPHAEYIQAIIHCHNKPRLLLSSASLLQISLRDEGNE